MIHSEASALREKRPFAVRNKQTVVCLQPNSKNGSRDDLILQSSMRVAPPVVNFPVGSDKDCATHEGFGSLPSEIGFTCCQFS